MIHKIPANSQISLMGMWKISNYNQAIKGLFLKSNTGSFNNTVKFVDNSWSIACVKEDLVIENSNLHKKT